VIFAAGEVLDSLFLLRRGRVSIQIVDSAGHDVVIRVVKPGEIFGFSALCDAGERHACASAIAAVASEIAAMPRPEFTRALKTDPQALFAALAIVSERLSYAEERIRIIADHRAEPRLAALLLQLARRTGYPSSASPNLVRIPGTHAELARMAGLSRTHVSVIMARFRGRQLVHYTRNSHPEIDPAALWSAFHADLQQAEHAPSGDGAAAIANPW
jgi:CRP/FNR family transcriptional regulator, nitrogen oxide reductase regulator